MPPVVQLPSEDHMEPCDTVEKRPLTSTHLMSPCYTERRPSHNIIYTVDYKFSYHGNTFICTCSHSSLHNSEAEILNILKLCQLVDISPLCHQVADKPWMVGEGLGTHHL